jgi:hypothetical protein
MESTTLTKCPPPTRYGNSQNQRNRIRHCYSSCHGGLIRGQPIQYKHTHGTLCVALLPPNAVRRSLTSPPPEQNRSVLGRTGWSDRVAHLVGEGKVVLPDAYIQDAMTWWEAHNADKRTFKCVNSVHSFQVQGGVRCTKQTGGTRYTCMRHVRAGFSAKAVHVTVPLEPEHHWVACRTLSTASAS